MSARLTEKQRTEKHPNSLMNLRPFQPGQSGNPGGVPKGTVFISDVVKRLLTLSTEEFEAYQPKNVAESIAKVRVANSRLEEMQGLAEAREIWDRTEGKAPQTIKHEDVSEIERLVIRVQERFLAHTGVELTREQAIEQIVAYKPELAGQIK